MLVGTFYETLGESPAKWSICELNSTSHLVEIIYKPKCKFAHSICVHLPEWLYADRRET